MKVHIFTIMYKLAGSIFNQHIVADKKESAIGVLPEGAEIIQVVNVAHDAILAPFTPEPMPEEPPLDEQLAEKEPTNESEYLQGNMAHDLREGGEGSAPDKPDDNPGGGEGPAGGVQPDPGTAGS